MIKTLDLRRDHLARGSVLRHARSLFDTDRLRYDPEHAAGLSEVVVGEIDEPVTDGVVDPRVDGFEQFEIRDGQHVFSRRSLRRGLIAIPIGNRYAPKCISGGLHNPFDLGPNGEVVSGSTVTNLAGGCIAGFVNTCVPADRPLTRIRVLGTLVDEVGRPVSTMDFVTEQRPRQGPPAHGVLVGGAGMEVGKTTVCTALFQALRAAGVDVTYHKATGTNCFLGDPLRVQTDGASVEGLSGELAVDPSILRVSDFVDACGVPSDMSTDLATYTRGMCRFLAEQPGEVFIVELADSLHHRTNAGLLDTPAFRSNFRSLLYIVDASFDAAQNFVYFIRDVVRWDEVRLAFAGPVATAPEHEPLRAEIHARLGVPCIDSSDGDALLDWVGSRQATIR